MKLKDVITALDRSNEMPLSHGHTESLAHELGIRDELKIPTLYKVYESYLFDWLCTDTQVGISVLFFNDLPVCLCSQQARRMDKEFTFFEGADIEGLKTWLRSLIKQPPEPEHAMISLDYDIDEYQQLSYTLETVYHSQVLYKEQMIAIDKAKTRELDRSQMACKQLVLANGETVKLANCRFRLNLKV